MLPPFELFLMLNTILTIRVRESTCSKFAGFATDRKFLKFRITMSGVELIKIKSAPGSGDGETDSHLRLGTLVNDFIPRCSPNQTAQATTYCPLLVPKRQIFRAGRPGLL